MRIVRVAEAQIENRFSRSVIRVAAAEKTRVSWRRADLIDFKVDTRFELLP